MARTTSDSIVLTIRVATRLKRQLTREPRRQRKTRSEIARNILQERFGSIDELDLSREARRQSLLVSRRRSDAAALKVVSRAADLRGWKQ